MVSGNMIDEAPVIFYVRKSDRKIYDRLRASGAPLKGFDIKHVFMMALATGFREKRRHPLDKKKDLFRTEYLKHKEYSIIKAIAVTEEGNLEVLCDKKKVHTIAEEYAAAGIKLLESKTFSGKYGSYIKKLEESLVSAFEKIGKSLS